MPTHLFGLFLYLLYILNKGRKVTCKLISLGYNDNFPQIERFKILRLTEKILKLALSKTLFT